MVGQGHRALGARTERGGEGLLGQVSPGVIRRLVAVEAQVAFAIGEYSAGFTRAELQRGGSETQLDVSALGIARGLQQQGAAFGGRAGLPQPTVVATKQQQHRPLAAKTGGLDGLHQQAGHVVDDRIGNHLENPPARARSVRHAGRGEGEFSEFQPQILSHERQPRTIPDRQRG